MQIAAGIMDTKSFCSYDFYCKTLIDQIVLFSYHVHLYAESSPSME